MTVNYVHIGPFEPDADFFNDALEAFVQAEVDQGGSLGERVRTLVEAGKRDEALTFLEETYWQQFGPRDATKRLGEIVPPTPETRAPMTDAGG